VRHDAGRRSQPVSDALTLSADKSSPTVIAGVGEDCLDEHTVKRGIEQRIERFGFDEFGEPNFQLHGPIGIDLDCDGVADVVTYQPGQGTDGVVPAAHRSDGANRERCRGMVDVAAAIEHGCV
jgi:hypothetical protein